jgi:hypothetical protein
VIRPLRLTDYDAVANLCRDLGLAAPPLRGTLIDERDGAVAGYVRVQRLGAIGYVRDLVTSPRSADGGLGLMLAAASSLRACGVNEWHLDVRPESSTTSVYEQLGMHPEFRSTAMRFPWACLPDLPGEPATALPIASEEDDDIERALGLLSGQLAMMRQRPQIVMRQLRDDACAPVGVGVLDVEGARVFRVIRPTLAAPLLAALRPHALHADLALVLEDDPLTTLLSAHGGRIVMRLLHYSGLVP